MKGTGKADAGRVALLEAFAEACTEVARGVANDKTLDWEAGKDGFVHFHCPLSGKHTWTGAPRASAWIKAGKVETHCHKCVGDKKSYPDLASYEDARSAYTEQVKRAIRWEQDGVVHAGFKTEVVRSHLYVDRGFRHAIRRDKIRYEDGRKERGNANPWRWRVAELANDAPGPFSPMRAEPWLAANYPEHATIYEALCWYGVEHLIDPSTPRPVTADTIVFRPCRIVLTEGEHDSDTFNALMRAVDRDDLFATCLSHPKPAKFASHHLRLLDGRDVVVIGDADEAGEEQAENVATLAWGHAKTIKIVREQLGLPGTKEAKDLTDWVVQRVGLPPGGGDFAEWLEKSPAARPTSEELIDLFASTAPLIEPPGHPTEWRNRLIETKGGGVKADSPHNAARVWTMHPAFKGRVRINVRSGEVEVVDPPWGGGVVVGARNAAMRCAEWLEKTERMSLSTKVLEDMVRLETLIPSFNPLQGMLEVEWDGKPRLEGLFTYYLPLRKIRASDASMLARSTLEDLVRKMRGELVPQRLLVGVETSKPLDVAGALVGRHGCQHRGKVGDRDVARFARGEAIMVQITCEPIANRQAAMHSIPHLFASDTWIDTRQLSAPLYVAVGTPPVDPRTIAKIDERVFRYQLAGAPRMDDLRADSAQIIAEAVRKLEGGLVEVPDKDQLGAVDLEELLASSSVMINALWLYVTRDVEDVDLLNPRALGQANQRPEPRRHVVRSRFLEIMRAMLLTDYREVRMQELGFNAVAKAFGWGPRPKVGITPNIGKQIGIDVNRQRTAALPGLLMTDERIGQLNDYLFPEGDDDDPGEGSAPPPKGGGDDLSSEKGSDASKQAENGGSLRETSFTGFSHTPEPLGNPGVLPSFLEGTYAIEKRKDEKDSHTCVRAYDSKQVRGRRWLVGPEAVAAVRAILSRPGVAAIDFETFPTDPAWHADQAAEHAPDGTKSEARAKAKLEAQMGGRAHVRRACTLQVAHEDGAEVFVRLITPTVELPAMFAGRVADLCAHNAQFDVEVLLRHGVAVDVECTLLAAKAIYLTAMPENQPQPVGFSLASLVGIELGRDRDKTIRDRDWSLEASLDDEAVEYGLQDARDARDLWLAYRRRLEAEDLLDGYRVMQRALLPTAATNLRGLLLDVEAHAKLIRAMAENAAAIERDLDRLCGGQIDNHGSSPQVGTWIMEEVLETPIKPPAEPKLVGLLDFLASLGGLRFDRGGELRSLDLPKRVAGPAGKLSLEDATIAAWEAKYIRDDMSTFGDERPDERDLLAAIDRERRGNRVLTVEDDQRWRDYLSAKDHFDRLHRDDPYRTSHFAMRLEAKTGGVVKGWRTTKTGHLAITKASKQRKAEQLADAFPTVSEYLIKHAQWTKATKLIDSFGPTLVRWRDGDGRSPDCAGDGRVRGQAKVWAAWTGRQSCVNPNLQNQPREAVFRALWVAPAGRKLVIADYSQVELRLLAIITGDPRLLRVYREGLDVHAETARWAFGVDEPTKEQRRLAKTINFAIAYGSGAAGLSENCGFTLDEAKTILGRVLGAYEGLARYRESAPTDAVAGGAIRIRPKRRVLFTPESPKTTAINAPIQGGAASVQMLALRLLHDALEARPDLDSFTCASVHDEFLVEAPDDGRIEAVKVLLVDRMVRALVEIYPEAEEMGMARLTEAAACSSWAEKP